MPSRVDSYLGVFLFRSLTKPGWQMNPVWIFVPNLIGYLRIILSIIAIVYSYEQPYVFFCCYAIAQLLDAVDGMAARAFNQCSRFGAVLDMLCDRMQCLALMYVLGHLYPAFKLHFCALIVLDIISHWTQMYASLIQQKTSHKGSSNPIINLYYTNKLILFFVCAGNEGFLCCLYMQYFFPANTVAIGQISAGVWTLLTYACLPIAALKQLIGVIQLVDACASISAKDLEDRKRN